MDLQGNDLTSLSGVLDEIEDGVKEENAQLSFEDYIRRAYPDYRFHPYAQQLVNKLQGVAEGRTKRLMIFMPPRHGKSLTASQLFTGYYLRRNPSHEAVLASYGSNLSEEHSRQSRKYFQKTGGDLNPDKQKQREWETKQGGGLYATGVGGTLTGKGFNLGIVDDPIKNAEEAYSRAQRQKIKDWYKSVFLTRREGKDSAIIVIQTRWHKDDLAGWLLSREQEVGEGWTIINQPALAEPDRKFPDTCTVAPNFREKGEALCPERFDKEYFDKERKNVGQSVFASLYQQRPTTETGGIWQADWFPGFKAPDTQVLDRGFHWDLAFTDNESNSASAWVEAGKGSDGNIYVFDAGFDWLEFPDLIRKMKELGGPHHIEDKASGISAKQTLREEGVAAETVSVRGDKIARAKLASPVAERGQVFIHPKCRDTLLNDTRQGLLYFPNGSHDDLADAFSQALDYLSNPGEDGQQTIGGMTGYVGY